MPSPPKTRRATLAGARRWLTLKMNDFRPLLNAQLGYPQPPPPHFFSGYTTGGAAAPSAPLRPAVMYTSVTRVIYICELYSSYHALARGFLALLQGGHRQGVRQILSSGAFFGIFA